MRKEKIMNKKRLFPVIIAVVVLLTSAFVCPLSAPSATQTPMEQVYPEPQITPLPSLTPSVCPVVTTSTDPALVNAAILKLQLPQVVGKPFPVTSPQQLLEYFSINNVDPAAVVVDSDCTTLQIEPVAVGNGYATFNACNPTDRRFDGWRSAFQAIGQIADQQGFPTGLWLLEGVSFAPKPDGSPIVAVPGVCP